MTAVTPSIAAAIESGKRRLACTGWICPTPPIGCRKAARSGRRTATRTRHPSVNQRPYDIASKESRPAEYRRQTVGFPGGFGHRRPLYRRAARLGEGRASVYRETRPPLDKSLGVRLLTRGDHQIGRPPGKLGQMIEFGLERADTRGRGAQFDNEIADLSLRDQRPQRFPARPALPGLRNPGSDRAAR